MSASHSSDSSDSRAPTVPASVLPLHVEVPTLGSCAVRAGGLLGLDFCPITVEVAARRGPSCFHMAGLAETAVREARIRLHSALSHLGITLDEYALTVNLAPAHLRKSGTGLDLAIAVGILGAIGRIDPDTARDSLFLAEVSLGGQLRPVPGVLPLMLGARRQGLREAFVSVQNAFEASEPEGLTVRAARDLNQVLEHLRGNAPVAPSPRQTSRPSDPGTRSLDLADVRGQPAAKRALQIAAAGGHHLLLIGSPGSGKSLLARRLPGLLPPLSRDEAIEATSIHSVAGLLQPQPGLLTTRPFRAPHHTVSEAGLIGGGSIPRPGEISLAHKGVLFLDELPEFRRSTLESLRQPLEDHEVRIVRSKTRAIFPAHPLLVCAMNPCPCGHWGNPVQECRCPRKLRLRYLHRISGPLLDRIDLHVFVPPVSLKDLATQKQDDSWKSGAVVERVLLARKVQEERQSAQSSRPHLNAQLSLKELEDRAPLESGASRLLHLAMETGQFSARSYVRVLRVARTIADLAASASIAEEHLGEALRYRVGDLSQL